MLSSSVDKSTCRLCGRQFAKYNCPTCNVPYCSLTCFRSEAHAQCSEMFYKKEVETEIQSEPSKTPQERLRMIEVLKKFEENQQNDVAGTDGDDDGEDLARRFEEVDLDAASSADLWSKLTPAEQAEFLKLMEDPASDLAQKLLSSEELGNERREPWWDAPGVAADSISRTPHRYGSKPDIMHIPAAMVKPIPTGPPLIYNICAICMAYSFVTRQISVSPLSSLKPEDVDFEEAKLVISQLVPFLVERRSTTLHQNLTSLVTDLWSRFKPDQVNSKLFSILLKDSAILIRPLVVTTVTAGSLSDEEVDALSHPHSKLVLSLSDLIALFSPTQGAKKTHVTHKLIFYAAYVVSTPAAVLRALAEELEKLSVSYQLRAEGDVATNVNDLERLEDRAVVIEEI